MQWGAVAKGSVVSGWTRVTEKISEEIVEVSAARLALVCRGSSGWGRLYVVCRCTVDSRNLSPLCKQN